MSDRPPADTLAPVMLEGTRLTDHAREHLIADLRCTSNQRHLLAVVIWTEPGLSPAWSTHAGTPDPHWQAEWVDAPPPERLPGCPCGARRAGYRAWFVSTPWLANRRGPVLASSLPPQQAPPDTD